MTGYQLSGAIFGTVNVTKIIKYDDNYNLYLAQTGTVVRGVKADMNDNVAESKTLLNINLSNNDTNILNKWNSTNSSIVVFTLINNNPNNRDSGVTVFNKRLSKGAIAGISVGVILFVILILLYVYWENVKNFFQKEN